MDQASSLRKIVRTQAAELQRVSADRGISDELQNPPPRVIAVTSGKGGVGKTNVAGNLGVSFARRGCNVLILDADLGLANIDIIFGLHPSYNIGHVINGEKELAEIIIDGPEGIRIIPAGSGFINLTQLTEGQKLHLLSEFDALEDLCDILLIDTGAGVSSNVIYFNLAAEDCLILATPEPTAVTDAYAMMKIMSGQHGSKRFKLLLNMVKDSQEAKNVYLNLCQAADRFLDSVVIEYTGYIPSDDRVRKAVRQRTPFTNLYPDALASRQIDRIAADMLEAPRRLTSESNIKFFLKRYMAYRT